jgi:hypothetical protein
VNWLTEAEVADRTKIAVSTLQGWRVAKKGPPFAKVGRMIRYPDDQLAAWQQAQLSA